MFFSRHGFASACWREEELDNLSRQIALLWQTYLSSFAPTLSVKKFFKWWAHPKQHTKSPPWALSAWFRIFGEPQSQGAAISRASCDPEPVSCFLLLFPLLVFSFLLFFPLLPHSGSPSLFLPSCWSFHSYFLLLPSLSTYKFSRT